MVGSLGQAIFEKGKRKGSVEAFCQMVEIGVLTIEEGAKYAEVDLQELQEAYDEYLATRQHGVSI